IWALAADTGTGTIIDDTTIKFEASTLPNSQSYEAVLMGLRVINASGDTITIPDTVARVSFITIALPPRLQTLSIFDNNNLIRSADTLTASFTTKLDSAQGAAGPLVSIVIPRAPLDDSIVPSKAWLDGTDSTKIHILPNHTLTPGQNYTMKIGLSGLTGDSTQDLKWPFLCQESFRLNIIAAPMGGLTCLDTVHFDPGINENYHVQYDSSFDTSAGSEVYDTSGVRDTDIVGTIVHAGDTVRYTAPSEVGGATFKQWSGSGNLAIDTSTNPVLTVSETGDQLRDMNVVALYAPVSVDTVCVSTSGANTPAVNSDFVAVLSDSQDCPNRRLQDTCASQSSVNYLLERGKAMTLHAYTTSDSVVFDHWSSADTMLDGQKSPSISFYTHGDECASAVFAPTPQGDCKITAFIKLDDGSDAPSSVATISSFLPTFPPNTIFGPCCTYQAVTLDILDPSYGLASYSINGGSCTTVNMLPESHTYSHDFTWDLAPRLDGNPEPLDLYTAHVAPFTCAGNGTFTPPLTSGPMVPVPQNTDYDDGT
ncbi:MAG: hypothetical protein ACREBW_05150, partial [Candidatus Micrarchaeaceae archaeon]